MKRQITLKRLSIGLIVVLVLVSFACQLFAPLREQATPMAAASATPAPPTLTPMPLPAPRLLFRSPEVGEKQGVASPVELTFDQPMDRESVEDAFSISPEVAGKFTWRDDRTVLFAAQAPFDRGAAYQITVDDTARNREGAPLSEPVTVDFTTVGFLEVSQVSSRCRQQGSEPRHIDHGGLQPSGGPFDGAQPPIRAAQSFDLAAVGEGRGRVAEHLDLRLSPGGWVPAGNAVPRSHRCRA
jgi:hypothetical protein